MVILNTLAPAVFSVEKNCYRCGKDFNDFSERGLARVCEKCKKPKVKPLPLKGEKRSVLGQPLTVRQVQVVKLLAKGKLNKQIATDLHLDEGTIKVIVSILLAKTGFTNRTELAVWWVQQRRPAVRRPVNPRARKRA
jgi:DNA-binding CsgD family transcriptional regulator